jgi:hypothetical protein
MKVRELDRAVAKVARLLRSRGLEPAQAKRLRQVERELRALRHAGRMPERRVHRVVATISELACDALLRGNQFGDML